MAHEYVRICPVCDTENPPALARCACGALLSGVDFSLKPAPVEAPAASPSEATVPPASPGTSGAVCPHPDCGQPNPVGQTRCIYCNRPMAQDTRAAAVADAPPSPGAFSGGRVLPAALRNDYRIVESFPVSGSEADILLVEALKGGERRVAKLYRRGLAPDFRLLTILSQTVGDTVVRVLDHGVSEGEAYELLEYVPGGTLEDLLRSGPLPVDDVRRIVAEIADALNGIHAHRILHRDLKPENVLVRSRAPLELALTDFGIASLSDATQHFTSVARTTMYAAPEVLTGVLDEKSDWWALGMVALEAAQGRHPFDGLTEHVMNHHLATKPIDVRGVYDDALRLLCRGLLLRDPKRRWGPVEVARWLAGDPTLTVPDDTAASAVRPYRVGTTESTTAGELALALAKHWDEARKDLARGQVASWLEHELHDYNLVRKLRDIQDHRDLTDDARLLRFLAAAAPDLPPVWRGLPVGDEAILDAARRAAGGDDPAQSWLETLFDEAVLVQFARDQHPQLHEIERCWRESWGHFVALWEIARANEAAWRRKPRAVAGVGAEVVSYDDVMYGAAQRLSLPAQSGVNASLLLAQVDADYVSALRGEIVTALGEVTGYCPWYEALWEKVQGDAVGVLVAHRLLRYARDDAAQEMRRAGVTQEARARIIEDTRNELRDRLNDVIGLAPEDRIDADADSVPALLDALERFQQACQRAASLGLSDPDCVALNENAEKLSAIALSASRALTRCERVRGINSIFLRPERLLIGAVVIVVGIAIRAPVVGLSLIGAAVAWIIYRLSLSSRATRDAVSRLRSLRLNGRAYLRMPGDD